MSHTLNGISLQLAAENRLRLEAVYAHTQLAAGQVLESPKNKIQDPPIYLLEGATATLWVETGTNDERMAVGLVGSEGMVGLSQLWEQGHAPWSAEVLTPGAARVTTARKLRELIAVSPDLVSAISRFLWQQTQEIAQLSARSLLSDLRTRLALWLHLMQHKTGQNCLPVTHDALARMLGTRRVSITLMAGELQSIGVITLQRGQIVINDTEALAAIARLKSV